MATELENLVPEADVEVEGMRGPKGDKGDSYVLTEADKEEIAQKVDKIIDAETDKTLTLSGKPADAKAAGDEINDLKADLSEMQTATAEDVGKALLAKTVTEGKVTEWEFGEAGGGFDELITDTTLLSWEAGSFDSGTGADYSVTGRIRNQQKVGLTTGIHKITTDDGFVFLLFAWDTNGTFIGSYKTGNVFNKITTGGFQYVNTFDCKEFPDYIFKIVVKNVTSDNISISDGDKCHLHGFTDKSLSQENKVADAKVTGDLIRNLDSDVNLVVRDANDIANVDYDIHANMYLKSDGTPATTTYSDSLISFVVTDATNILFKVAQRVSGGNLYAFYSSETYEECTSATLIGSVKQYSNWAHNTVSVPDGANMMLIQHGGNRSYIQTQKLYRKSIADEAVENLSKKIDVTFDDTMDFSAYCDFTHGRKGADTTVVWVNNQLISTKPFYVERDIVINIAEGYGCTINYFNPDGHDNGSTGGQTSLQYRTILAGSYIMVTIYKSSLSQIKYAEIPDVIKAVTFSTEYYALKSSANKINDVNDYAALMYQRGQAPKSFDSTGIGIICAGQSQMDGRVPLSDLPTDIISPMEHAYYVNLSTGATSNLSVTGAWNVSTSLFDSLSKAGIDAYMIKYAVGDTGLHYTFGSSNWSPFFEKTLKYGYSSLLRTLENGIRKAMATKQNLYDIRAFVWMQGEKDRASLSKLAALEYYKELKCLIAYVRGVVGNKNLPFVCGTVSRLSSQYDKIVEEATIKVCDEDDNAICIDMSGAPLLSDGVHLNADSAVYFGRMAYDALIDLKVISGTKLNPTRPW